MLLCRSVLNMAAEGRSSQDEAGEGGGDILRPPGGGSRGRERARGVSQCLTRRYGL